MQLRGDMSIGAAVSHGTGEAFRARNPATGEPLEPF